MSTFDDCVFCKIVAGEIPAFKIYEDEHTLAFMDIHPANEGHALVIPKEHTENAWSISAEDMARTAETVRRVAAAVVRTVENEGLNLLQANGPAAGQSVFHFHIHVLPRRDGDGLGMTWDMPPQGDMRAIEALAARIRAAITD